MNKFDTLYCSIMQSGQLEENLGPLGAVGTGSPGSGAILTIGTPPKRRRKKKRNKKKISENIDFEELDRLKEELLRDLQLIDSKFITVEDPGVGNKIVINGIQVTVDHRAY